MLNRRVVFKNIFFSLFANIIDKVFGLVVLAYLARTVGVADFGIWGFALSFTTILFLVIRLGFDTLLLREIPAHINQAPIYFSNALIARIFAATIAFLLLGLFSPLLGKSQEAIEILYLVFLLNIFISLTDFGNLFFRGFYKMEYEAFIISTRATLKLIIGIAVLHYYGTLFPYVWSTILVAFFICIVGFWGVFKKLFRFQWSFDFRLITSLLKSGFPFLILGSFVILYSQIDIVMLSVMKDDTVTGWYKAANTLYSIFSFIPISFVGAVLPALSHFYHNSYEGFVKTYNEALKYLFILALPIVWGIFLLADKFMILFFGDQYTEGVMALQIIIWALITTFLTPIVGNVLIASRKEKITLYIAAISAVLNIGLNFILIPTYSLNGASIATVITGAFSFFAQLFFIIKYHGKVNFSHIFPRPLVAVLVMGLFTYFMKDTILFLNIFLSGIVYIGMLFLLRAIKPDDLALLKSLLLRNKTV